MNLNVETVDLTNEGASIRPSPEALSLTNFERKHMVKMTMVNHITENQRKSRAAPSRERKISAVESKDQFLDGNDTPFVSSKAYIVEISKQKSDQLRVISQKFESHAWFFSMVDESSHAGSRALRPWLDSSCLKVRPQQRRRIDVLWMTELDHECNLACEEDW
ncbi:hypothetical protein NC653_012443 [Populus alba x Populus x berolinensis]|uniref:Uncharacterized protein n=1 Tax=Populus alba x Populus x berolinensis TaxID=444605 RepID=A0AAD6QRZ5_9ROSI|nr:hypothetical protein NC653_012443 [Populus alba x Populus x berolinensis]